MEKETTLLYRCPKCKKENEVYLFLDIIEDQGNYKFDTECSYCKQALFIVVNFNLNIKIV